MKEKKKKKGLARLMEIAGQRKGLLIVAGTLSALSSACMLVPYWAVYEVLRLLLTGNAASGEMVHWGWVAFGGLVAGLVLLYLALMASHVAAFNVLYGLRIRITEHIGRLSLGYLNGTTTGVTCAMYTGQRRRATSTGSTIVGTRRAVWRQLSVCVV